MFVVVYKLVIHVLEHGGQILIVTGFTVIMLLAKYLPIFMYCMKPLMFPWKLNEVRKNQHVTAGSIMEPDLCAKFQICTLYGC